MFKEILQVGKNKGFLKYFKNTSWLMGEQFLRIISGVFLSIWIARYLGPEDFGLFSYVIAFSAILSGFAKLGLDSIIVRELLKYPEEKENYLGSAYWLKNFGAMVALIIVAFILPSFGFDKQENFLIFVVVIGLFFQSHEVIEFYFQSEVKAKFISICKMVQLFVSSFLKVVLLTFEADVFWFVLIITLDSMFLAIGYLFFYKALNKDYFYRFFSLSLSKKLLMRSWPLMLSMIMIMLYMKIDQIMIKNMLNDYQVGQYSAGVKLVEGVFFIPTIIVTSLFPAIINAKNNNEALYEKRMIRLLSALIYFSIPIVLLLYFGSYYIVAILFGEGYSLSASVLKLYSISLPFVFVSVASSRWFVAEEIQRKLFYRAFCAVLLNVLLNYLLIPIYGIDGAAISTVITYMFIGFLFDFFNAKTRYLAGCKIKAIFFWGVFK